MNEKIRRPCEVTGFGGPVKGWWHAWAMFDGMVWALVELEDGTLERYDVTRPCNRGIKFLDGRGKA